MSLNPYTPGPGDSITWGPYLGRANDPREPDDDAITADMAAEFAEHELMRSPYALAWALNNDCGIDDADERVDVDTVCRPELVAQDATTAQLLAVVLNSACRDTVYRAATELAERLKAVMAPLIAERAAEILKAQEVAA